MKQYLREWVRWFHELLLLLPFFTLLTYFTAGDLSFLPGMLVILLAVLVGGFLSVFARRVKIVYRIAAGLLAVVCLGKWLLPDGIPLYIVMAEAAALFLWSLRVSYLPIDEILSPKRIMFGVMFYGLAYIVMFFARISGACRLIIEWGGAVYFVASLFILNSNCLQSAALVRDGTQSGVPPSVRRSNWILTSVFLIITVIVINIKTIKDAFTALIRWMIYGIFWLIELLGNILKSNPPSGGDMQSGVMELPPELISESEPPAWVDAIVYVIGTIILVVAVCALLYVVVKKLWVLLKRLIQWLKQYFEQWKDYAGEGYVDEHENLFTWEKMRDDLFQGVKEWWNETFARKEKWEDFTNNRDRIRYLYRVFLRKIADSVTINEIRSLTPNELSNNQSLIAPSNSDAVRILAEAYNAARFSDHELSDEIVSDARKATMNIK